MNLFDIPETPIPPLEAARQRLARAMEAEREAERIFEEQGPEALPGLEYARHIRIVTAKTVEVLERETIKGANL